MALLNVLIYCGAGICQFSLNQTFKTLQRFLKNSYDVKLVSLETLSNAKIPWETDCALFVMPGGRDCPYMNDLTEHSVIPRIKNAMSERGMKYLGICAGAYFGADRIEFEIGREGYEVCQDRPLKFIEGLAKGPLPGRSFYYSDDPKCSNHEVSAVAIQQSDHCFKVAYNGGCYFPETTQNVLAEYGEPDLRSPAIILKENSFCLSGVHFEYDPMDCLSEDQCTGKVFSELLASNESREALIKDILTKLNLSVSSQASDSSLSQIQIQVSAPEFFQNVPLNSEKGYLNFISPKSAFHEAFTSKCPGVLFLHSHVITSTQTVLLNEPDLLDYLPDFTLLLADHQMSGRGRGTNNWISSPACLQFTLKVEHPSRAAHKLPCVQFLMAIALAQCINLSTSLRPGLSARIKWPNDIYLTTNTEESSLAPIGKISGILVNCVNSVKRDFYHVLIGVGVNLFSDPSQSNITHLSDHLSSPVNKDEFLAELTIRFRNLYSQFLLTDEFPFSDYYAYWLHSNQIVQFADSENGNGSTCRIRGIDEFGYLVGVNEKGLQVKFEPDGNSFDMMKNLIKRKL